MAQGAKPATQEGAPSVASVLASGSLDPKDVIEMNLQVSKRALQALQSMQPIK